MHPELEKLIFVQDMDQEIHKLRDELARYPGLRKARTAEIERERARVDSVKSQLHELEKLMRSCDLEVRQSRDNLGKLLAQQSKVKNQKEYDALTLEMQKTEQKILDLDEKGLNALTQQEDLQKQLGDLSLELSAREQEYQDEIERLIAREREKSEQLQDHSRRREIAASRVESSLMRRYERLSSTFPDNCIAHVADGNCSGCFMRILPRRMQDLARPDVINECDSCHRLLYLPEK